MPTDPSLNALKHGCTSKQKLVHGESEQEWNELRQAWLDDYKPDSSTMLSLVLQAFDAEWQLRRGVRRYDEAEQTMPEHVMEWSDSDHKRLERFTRYRTTAERSFHRARNAVEQTRRNKEMQAHRSKQLDLQIAREQKAPRNKKNVEPEPKQSEASRLIEEYYNDPVDDTPALVQHVNIYVEEGKTRTEVFPTNEDLLEKSKTEPPIGRVFRSIHFFDGVPPEYLWVRGVKRDGGDQILTFAEWLELTEREKQSGTGHLAPPLEALERQKRAEGEEEVIRDV